MATKTAGKNGFTVKAYQGDAKTLLAFNLPDKTDVTQLAGFTIRCQPKGQATFFLQNSLQFEVPGDHTQDQSEPPSSSVNAPIHKFRWLHVPGSLHQGVKPIFGPYKYTVTPRFFVDNSLQPIDPKLSVSLDINVQPFQKNGLELGFTRGFTQSQAFVHHFGLKASIRPKDKELQFDTSQVSGTNSAGESFTFQDEYEWLGFTARAKIFDVLDEVIKDKSLSLDVFAYDLNEPDVIGALLNLAKQGRVRVILDNATLHHDAAKPKPEDEFEALFNKAAKKPAAILRGKFGRFAHDKIFIVSKGSAAQKALTGSTNFSVTGLYVNSNHVLVFNDPKVAAKYSEVFETAWQGKVSTKSFSKSALAGEAFSISSRATPQTEITFSPHPAEFATTVLDGVAKRIEQEGKKAKASGSVLFAVMELASGTGPIFPALKKLHSDDKIFSFGISDSPDGIALYSPGKKTGVLVTGKPVGTKLPPPFDQVPGVGLGHQVHHKFIVCGFNGDDAVTFCGSSNLALAGEQVNGDNLIAIHDGNVATVFAIEALALVDHFQFLDRAATAKAASSGKKTKPSATDLKPKFASKQQEAVSAGWFLTTDGGWAKSYFDPKDLHFIDRELFG